MKANTDFRRKDAFDKVALLYDQVRPGYPNELISDIFTNTSWKEYSNCNALEIGCGTGQATQYFLLENTNLTCIDIGGNLLRIAERKLKSLKVRFVESSFEDFIGENLYYDFIFSATAFHWIPANISYPKCRNLLNNSGSLIIFLNFYPSIDENIKNALEEIYRKFAPDIFDSLYKRESKTPEQEFQEGLVEIKKVDEFKLRFYKTYPWKQTYNSKDYTKLLNTYANYQRLESQNREILFNHIEQIIDDNYSGKITNYYLASLFILNKNL